MDRDIYGGLANIPIAEGLARHRWTVTDEMLDAEKKKKDDIAMYNFNPRLDHNIVVSQHNLARAESAAGQKMEEPVKD